MFRIAAWAGLSSVVVAFALTVLFPLQMGPLPSGMRTPILAFELARTQQEVETMFGPPQAPERAAWQHAMNVGNYADFGFMLVYGAFFLLFSRALATAGARFARVGAALAAAPSALDVLENLQLLAIADNLGGDYAAALSRLSLFTAFKWLSIAVVYASWIPGLWSRGWLGRLGAGLAALNAVATVLALATRGVAAELMGLGSGLTVIAATTLAWRSPRSS
jgi:hypothetical protein